MQRRRAGSSAGKAAASSLPEFTTDEAKLVLLTAKACKDRFVLSKPALKWTSPDLSADDRFANQIRELTKNNSHGEIVDYFKTQLPLYKYYHEHLIATALVLRLAARQTDPVIIRWILANRIAGVLSPNISPRHIYPQAASRDQLDAGDVICLKVFQHQLFDSLSCWLGSPILRAEMAASPSSSGGQTLLAGSGPSALVVIKEDILAIGKTLEMKPRAWDDMKNWRIELPVDKLLNHLGCEDFLVDAWMLR